MKRHHLPIIRRALVESDKFWLAWHKPDVCVAACRAMQLAMRDLGITLEPIVARARFLNARMQKAVDTGELDQYQDAAELARWREETGAWGVGLGYVDPKVALGFEPLEENKWGSHLALMDRKESLFIDPTMGQASRPQKGIVLPQSIADRVPVRFLNGEGEAGIMFGSAIGYYKVFPSERNTWYVSPDWREKKRHKQLVKQILKAIR